MKAPTRLGARLLSCIKGFRWYLGTTGKQALAAPYKPKARPDLFGHYLPYAVALDVDDAWAERFASTLSPKQMSEALPSWYQSRALMRRARMTLPSSPTISFPGSQTPSLRFLLHAVAAAAVKPPAAAAGQSTAVRSWNLRSEIRFRTRHVSPTIKLFKIPRSIRLQWPWCSTPFIFDPDGMPAFTKVTCSTTGLLPVRAKCSCVAGCVKDTARREGLELRCVKLMAEPDLHCATDDGCDEVASFWPVWRKIRIRRDLNSNRFNMAGFSRMNQ